MADTTTAQVDVFLRINIGKIDGVEQMCVHARLLHQYLRNPIRFLKWFRIKSEALGFVCHRDYEPSFEAIEGMPPAENFLLTLQAATVLAAAEASDMGQELCRRLMETLSRQERLPSILVNTPPRPPVITTSQARILQNLAKERVTDTGLPYQTIWSEFKNRFGVRSYYDLYAEEFESACDFLNRPPQFLPSIRLNYLDGEREIILPKAAEEVIKFYSLDLSVDSLPFLRQILRNYIFQCANHDELENSSYVYELLSYRFKHITDCLSWANRPG